MVIELSIVTATIPERAEMFDRIHHQIVLQSRGLPVEHVIVDGDGTVGRKMNDGYRRAKGRYIATVDDDDTIEPDYVKWVLQYIHCDHPDVVTFGIRNHGSKYDSFLGPYATYQRDQANHLCAWKREIALASVFLPRNYGWDVVWSRAIRAAIPYPNINYSHIGKVMYHYNFSPEWTRAQSPASIADSNDNNGHRIRIVRLHDGRLAAGPSMDRMWVQNCQLINCSDLKEGQGYTVLDEVVF